MSQLDVLMKQINKQFEEEIVSYGIPEKDYSKIQFSSPRLNYMTYGGIPRGRLIEFAGEEGGGKTTTALDICANAQKLFKKEYEEEFNHLNDIKDCGGKLTTSEEARLKYLKETGVKRIVYCDCENTLDEEWARKLDVDVENMILLKPQQQTAEQIFEMILKIIETGEVGVVVLDSLGVLVSQQAYDKTMEEKTMGGIAAPLTLFSKKAIPLCSGNDCTLIAINQIREDMAGFGQLITVGGKGWKHNCSLRMVFKKGAFLDSLNNEIKRSSDTPAGNKVEVAIVKNKISPSDRKNGFYTLNYTNGIDEISDMIDLAILYGIIVKGGSWFTIIDSETGEIMQYEERAGYDDVGCVDYEKTDLKFQGKASLLDYLRDNEDVYEIIKEQVLERLG